MKKILVLILLSYGQLVALDRDSTLKIYEHLFISLSSKTNISVYVTDKEYLDVFHFSKKIQISDSIKKDDIVLITNERMLHRITTSDKRVYKDVILFATDYRFLNKLEDIVGAFYWKKGRTQLLFIKNRLKKHQITLPKEYHDFIVDEL